MKNLRSPFPPGPPQTGGTELIMQRFRECTLAKPTWLMTRGAYTNVPGGFDEGGRGTPEDLIFLYGHLEQGGALAKVWAAFNSALSS